MIQTIAARLPAGPARSALFTAIRCGLAFLRAGLAIACGTTVEDQDGAATGLGLLTEACRVGGVREGLAERMGRARVVRVPVAAGEV